MKKLMNFWHALKLHRIRQSSGIDYRKYTAVSKQFPYRFTPQEWRKRCHINTRHNHHCKDDHTLHRLRRLQRKHLGLTNSTFPHPVHTDRVIYALYNCRYPRRIYVGQTQRNAWIRFQEHVWAARRLHTGRPLANDDSPLHGAMAQYGWWDWRIVPLEHIPGTLTGAAFRKAAGYRETFWKRMLHVFLPHGFCIEGKSFKLRSRRRPPNTRPRPLMFIRAWRVKHNLHPYRPCPDPRHVPHRFPPPHRVPRDPSLFSTSLRCLRHMSRLMQRGNFHVSYLEACSLKKLTSLHIAVESCAPFDLHIPRSHATSMRGLLSRIIRTRVNGAADTVRVRRLLISPFLHAAMDELRLPHILHLPQVQAAMPLVVRNTFGTPIAAWHYSPTLGQIVFTHGKVSRDTTHAEMTAILAGPCACREQRYFRYLDPTAQHVMTADLSILPSCTLGDLFAKGTKFRPWVKSTSAKEVHALLTLSLRKFCTSICKDLKLAQTAMDVWCAKVIYECNARLTVLENRFRHIHRTTWLNNTDAALLEVFKKDFVITCVDKSANNFAFICKKHYLASLQHELASSTTYVQRAQTTDGISVAHTAFLVSQHISPKAFLKRQRRGARTTFPYLYLTLKLHKNPVALRTIAASHSAPLMPLSKLICHALNALLPEANALWVDVVSGAGIECAGSWIVIDSVQVRQRLQAFSRSKTSAEKRIPMIIETYDFTTLYTTLDLHDLKQRLASLITRLFARRPHGRNNLHVQVSRTKATATWLSGIAAGTIVRDDHNYMIQPTDLICWINYLVDNTFICFTGVVYQQVVGIPMGTNCAGLLANLYLYTFELDFMETLISSNDDALIKRFVHTCRYIDDVIVFDNPDFGAHLYKETGLPGIYPQASLTLKLTSEDTSCNYLDITITHNKKGWRTAIYDKRTDPKYQQIPFIRYPDIHSLLSHTAKYGVVLSQLHRFSRLCSYRIDFIKSLVELLHRLLLKGYDRDIMLRHVRCFLQRHPHLFGAFPWHKLYQQVVSRLARVVPTSI